MGITHYPDGISSFGVPVLGGSILTTGNIFFVDSGASNAADTTANGEKDMPFATIDYAVGRCTANNGDHIVAMPGHAETVSAAAGLDLDVAGITVVGIGRGTAQPTVTLGTAAAADVDIGAANVTVENLNFVANVADITAAIDVNATDFTLRNCRFTQAGDDLNALIWVQDAAAAGSDRITIENCHAIAYDASNTHFINLAGTGDGHIIRGNILIGDWGTMAIGGAGVVTNATCMNNVMSNAASDNDSCISFAATATGICVGNLVGSAAAQANQITATAMTVCENYGAVTTEDLSGVLEPATT